MRWNNVEDVATFVFVLMYIVFFFVAVTELTRRGFRRAFSWRASRHPERSYWPYRLSAYDMRAYRQSVAIRRFTGFADTPMLQSGREFIAWRDGVATVNARSTEQSVGVIPAILLIAATTAAYNTMPHSPESEGFYWGGMTGFLASFLMARRISKRMRDRERDYRCLRACAATLRTCYLAAKRESNTGPLAIDSAITSLCSELGAYAHYWESDSWRSDMGQHVARVQNALRESAGDILRDGHQSLPETIRLLGVLFDRLTSERWLALLDEGDMPEYQGELIMPIARERKDYWISGISILATVTLVTAALLLGDLAGVSQVLPFLIFPVLLLGTDRLRGRVMEVFRGGTPQA